MTAGKGSVLMLSFHVIDVGDGSSVADARIAARIAGSDTVMEARTDALGRAAITLTAVADDALVDVVWNLDACGSWIDLVNVRLRREEGANHVHIPLVLAPYGASVYRGSTS
jgi:5-hydroxyisourate hydrolase-like protein (transthyretin family)